MRLIVSKIGVLWDRLMVRAVKSVCLAVVLARGDKVLLLSGSVVLVYGAVRVLTWVR